VLPYDSARQTKIAWSSAIWCTSHQPPPIKPNQNQPHLQSRTQPNPQPNPTAEGSFLQRFFQATQSLTPEQRGAYLEAPPTGAPDIEDAHQVGCVWRGWGGGWTGGFREVC